MPGIFSKMIRRCCCLILLIFFCQASHSLHQGDVTPKDQANNQLSVVTLSRNDYTLDQNPKSLEIAIGFSLAPYMLQNAKGIVGEIITETLAASGNTAKFHYMTNKEALDAFKAGKIDGVAVVKKNMVKGFYTDPIITFNNFAIGLSDKMQKLNRIEDLSLYTVAGFSNARKYLGDEFANMANINKRYEEIANQKEQARALLTQKVDLIIADKLIFEFNQSLLIHEHTFEKQYRQKVNFYPLFTPSTYYAAFKSKQQAELFNRGYKKVIASGRINQIYEKYTDLLKQY